MKVTRPHDDRILRPVEAARKLGYKSRTAVYSLAREGRLPPPIRISPRLVGWRESTINAFIARCEQASPRAA